MSLLLCYTFQTFRFSYAELRNFLNMFYEEEEREADRIRTKYLLIRYRLFVVTVLEGLLDVQP